MKTTVLTVLCFSLLLVGTAWAQFGDDFGTVIKAHPNPENRQILVALPPKPGWPPMPSTPKNTSDIEKLRQKLEERTTIELTDNDTFENLFNILKEKFGIQSIIDPRGAGALGITLSSPVVRELFRLEDVPLRRILQMVLAEQDLTYVIDEGFLQITSEDEAKRYMKVKVYPVADLVVKVNPNEPVAFGDSVRGPTSATRRDLGMNCDEYDFSELMDLIECTVAPDSWDEGGEMMEFYPGLCLVVRQTDEVHDQIENLLAQLRAKRVEPEKKVSESKTAKIRRTPHRRTGFGGLRRR